LRSVMPFSAIDFLSMLLSLQGRIIRPQFTYLKIILYNPLLYWPIII